MVEILVVLAIMAILSSVALVSYGSYRKTLSVKSTAQQIQQLFATARSNAINTNSPCAASFDLNLSRQSFWVDEMDATGTTVTRAKVTGVGFPAKFVLLNDILLTPAGTPVQASATMNTIVRVIFHPDGRGSLASVHIRREFDDVSDPSAFYTVRVFSSTGLAEIYANGYLTQ